jgi:hypothetical protein
MRFETVHNIPLPDLVAMAKGAMEDTISDLDFLETLAAHQCFIIPPYVLRADSAGHLHRVTRLRYTLDGELDKARILVHTARSLRDQRTPKFGGRFAS